MLLCAIHLGRNGNTHTYIYIYIDYGIIVLTVPRMYVLQMGQLRSFGEHLSRETRCPQGRKTVLMSLSMQTLHVFTSRSRRFSAISRSSATKHCRVSSFIISNSTISSIFSRQTTITRINVIAVSYSSHALCME